MKLYIFYLKYLTFTTKIETQNVHDRFTTDPIESNKQRIFLTDEVL